MQSRGSAHQCRRGNIWYHLEDQVGCGTREATNQAITATNSCSSSSSPLPWAASRHPGVCKTSIADDSNINAANDLVQATSSCSTAVCLSSFRRNVEFPELSPRGRCKSTNMQQLPCFGHGTVLEGDCRGLPLTEEEVPARKSLRPLHGKPRVQRGPVFACDNLLKELRVGLALQLLRGVCA